MAGKINGAFRDGRLQEGRRGYAAVFFAGFSAPFAAFFALSLAALRGAGDVSGDVAAVGTCLEVVSRV